MAEAERLTIRPTSSLLVAATSSAAAFAFPAMFAIALLGWNRNVIAWSLVGAISFSVFVWALVRVRCVVSNEGVEVANLWRTHEVPWTSFQQAEEAEGWFGAAFFFSSFSPIRIRTNDGRKIIVQASLLNLVEVAQAIEARRPG